MSPLRFAEDSDFAEMTYLVNSKAPESWHGGQERKESWDQYTIAWPMGPMGISLCYFPLEDRLRLNGYWPSYNLRQNTKRNKTPSPQILLTTKFGPGVSR